MGEDISCPRCKTTKYRNPSLKLFVNVCGHGLCEACVELLFVKGSGSCPECGISLRRNNFRLQLFEDSFVEKEVDIRKKVLRDYNKTEEDFETLEEYNDYLEEVETIVYNLANNVDVEATKRQMEQYKKDNAEFIQRARGRLSKDAQYIEALLEEEREQENWRRQVMDQMGNEESTVKKKHKEALVDELMFSDLPANQILASHVNERKLLESSAAKPLPPKPVSRPTSYFSTGIKVGKGDSAFLPVPKSDEAEPFKYEEPVFELLGPKCPKSEDLEPDGYLLHVRTIDSTERAGGFLPHYPCLRALQESFCGLYFKPDE